MTEVDEEHYLNILNSHLTRQQLGPPKVTSCIQTSTLTGPLFTLTLCVAAYSIEKVATGGTKREAKNNAAREIIKEIGKKTALQEVEVIGAEQSAKKKQHKQPISLLHEFVQKHKLGKPSYQLISRPVGNETDFKMEVTVGEYRQDGLGSTKKVAKTMASMKMYRNLMKDICDEEVEIAFESSDSRETTQEVAEQDVESDREYMFSDLADFQGTITSRLISEYRSRAVADDTAHFLVDPADLPDLEELGMTQSVIIEEQSDKYPVSYEVGTDWYFSSILMNKVQQQGKVQQGTGEVEVTFTKLKQIDNHQRSFLCFIKIRSKDRTDTPEYLNFTHDITLERATENLSYIALRHAEILDCTSLDELIKHELSDLNYLDEFKLVT